MAYCKVCGQRLSDDCAYCPKCGASVIPDLCPYCHTPLSKGCNFCVNCGHQFNRPQYVIYEQPKKKRWLAFLLCIFCGSLGVHRFYEGKRWTGLLYLCTGGLLGVGVLYDFIRIIFTNELE